MDLTLRAALQEFLGSQDDLPPAEISFLWEAAKHWQGEYVRRVNLAYCSVEELERFCGETNCIVSPGGEKVGLSYIAMEARVERDIIRPFIAELEKGERKAEGHVREVGAPVQAIAPTAWCDIGVFNVLNSSLCEFRENGTTFVGVRFSSMSYESRVDDDGTLRLRSDDKFFKKKDFLAIGLIASDLKLELDKFDKHPKQFDGVIAKEWASRGQFDSSTYWPAKHAHESAAQLAQRKRFHSALRTRGARKIAIS